MNSRLTQTDTSRSSARTKGWLRQLYALAAVLCFSALPAFGQTLIANGTYTITSKLDGQAVDVTGASSAEGTKLDEYTLSGNTNQQWQLTNLGNNYVKLISVESGLALEVYGASTETGAEIDQWPYDSGKNQIWQIVSKGSGYYEIVNENSGQALDVTNNDTAPGTDLDQYTVVGFQSEEWRKLRWGEYELRQHDIDNRQDGFSRKLYVAERVLE
jgi:hypothetical protein